MADPMIPDMFLKVPGAEGECKVDNYTDTIAVLNYDYGIYARTTLGHGSGQDGGRGTMTPISVELVHDKGFAKLRKMSGSGKIVESGVVLTRTADGHVDETVTLKDVKVLSASSNHSHGGTNTASVVLGFGTATVSTYIDNNGTFVIGDETTCDMQKGTTQ